MADGKMAIQKARGGDNRLDRIQFDVVVFWVFLMFWLNLGRIHWKQDGRRMTFLKKNTRKAYGRYIL